MSARVGAHRLTAKACCIAGMISAPAASLEWGGGTEQVVVTGTRLARKTSQDIYPEQGIQHRGRWD